MTGALNLGTGPTGAQVRLYRQIEAEAVTRSKSVIHKLESWLQLEAPEDIPLMIQRAIVHFVEATAARFGFTNRPPLMITILAHEVNAPWAVGRSGYFVQKSNFGKICIPLAALSDPRELEAVISHEYAHQIVSDLTAGLAPRWLNEAFATLAEDGLRQAPVRPASLRRGAWRNEHELESAFSASENDGPGRYVLHEAYEQSRWLGRYLRAVKGDAGFTRLLTGFTNNSRWRDIKMRLTGQEPVDEALKETYGFGVSELFRRAGG